MELKVIQTIYETNSESHIYRLTVDSKRGVFINRRCKDAPYILPLIENWNGKDWSGCLSSVKPCLVATLDEALEIIEQTSVVRFLIPASVLDHWEPKFDDIRQHGITCASDRTYDKVRSEMLKAAKGGKSKRTYLDATADDLTELREEVASQLDGDTDVANSNDLDYRRFRYGYRKLREALAATDANFAKK